MLKRAAVGVLCHPDLTKPTGPRRLMVRANQALFERGLAPPWVWDAEHCRDFWASQDEETGNGNAPSA